MANTGLSQRISRKTGDRSRFNLEYWLIGSGGAAIALGVYGLPLEVGPPCILESVKLFTTGVAGSITVQPQAAAYQGTFASIVGSSSPSIANAAVTPWSELTDLSGWTTTFDAGEFFQVNVTAIALLTQVLVSLSFRRSGAG